MTYYHKHKMEDHKQYNQAHSTTRKMQADANGYLNIRVLLTKELSSNAEVSAQRTNRSLSHTR